MVHAKLGELCGPPSKGDEFDNKDGEYAQETKCECVRLRLRMMNPYEELFEVNTHIFSPSR